jgi:hypothetical protein
VAAYGKNVAKEMYKIYMEGSHVRIDEIKLGA